MIDWNNQFESHPLISSIAKLNEVIDGYVVEDSIVDDDWERAGAVIRYLKARLDRMDPLLAPGDVLNSCGATAGQALAALTNFVRTQHVPSLRQANTHLDSLITLMTSLPQTVDAADVASFRESIVSFRRSAGALLKNIRDEAYQARSSMKAAMEQAATLNPSIESQKARLDEAIARFEAQFSEAQGRRASEYAELLRVQSDQFHAITRDLEKEVTAVSAAASDDFEATRKHFEESIETVLEAIRKREVEAARLVGIISHTGMVGGFQKEANEEKHRAARWSGVALGSLIALAFFSLAVFFEAIYHRPDIWAISTRLFVLFTFGAVATYAGRQASEHRAVEKRSRQMELELAAIDQYLEPLPEPVQHEIRSQLAFRWFAQGTKPSRETEAAEPAPIASPSEMAASIVRAVTETAIKAKT